MGQRRRYRNPPIEEALCEFRFPPEQDWDPTIPGKLQTKFGDEYTGKPREQRVVEVGLEAQEVSLPICGTVKAWQEFSLSRRMARG